MKGKHLYLFTGLLTIVFSLCKPQLLFAQEAREIKGTVLDGQTQTALPGVTVLVKGTKSGVATDNKGQFSIRATATDILIFSFMGYDKTEQSVGSSPHISICSQLKQH